MTEFTEITVSIPVTTYNQIADTAQKSGLNLDDLVGGACEMVYKNPTQSIIKRVLKMAQAQKIEKILAAFPKARKETNGENTE